MFKTYILRGINNNFQQKCISRLQTANGPITDSKDILEEERLFYLNLYASSVKEDFPCEFIKKVVLPNLDIKDDDFSLCDLISEKECYETITTFKSDKSPGSDGLPI